MCVEVGKCSQEKQMTKWSCRVVHSRPYEKDDALKSSSREKLAWNGYNKIKSNQIKSYFILRVLWHRHYKRAFCFNQSSPRDTDFHTEKKVETKNKSLVISVQSGNVQTKLPDRRILVCVQAEKCSHPMLKPGWSYDPPVQNSQHTRERRCLKGFAKGENGLERKSSRLTISKAWII